MTQTEKELQINTISILRDKEDNRTMKHGQLKVLNWKLQPKKLEKKKK